MARECLYNFCFIVWLSIMAIHMGWIIKGSICVSITRRNVSYRHLQKMKTEDNSWDMRSVPMSPCPKNQTEFICPQPRKWRTLDWNDSPCFLYLVSEMIDTGSSFRALIFAVKITSSLLEILRIESTTSTFRTSALSAKVAICWDWWSI